MENEAWLGGALEILSRSSNILSFVKLGLGRWRVAGAARGSSWMTEAGAETEWARPGRARILAGEQTHNGDYVPAMKTASEAP